MKYAKILIAVSCMLMFIVSMSEYALAYDNRCDDTKTEMSVEGKSIRVFTVGQSGDTLLCVSPVKDKTSSATAIARIYSPDVINDIVLSPDESKVAFVKDSVLNPKSAVHTSIYLVDVKTTTIVRVGSNANQIAYQPVWSPDGKHIAFSKNGPQTAIHIGIANTDGTIVFSAGSVGLNCFKPQWMDNSMVQYRTIGKDESVSYGEIFLGQ